MEQFPKANYSAKTQASNKVFENQARARDTHRSFLEKLTGRNKVTGFDMLKEEAAEANALVDKRSAEEARYNMPITPHQEIADEILQGEEFNRSSDETNFQEMVQARYPDIAQAIKQNAFNWAIQQTHAVSDSIGNVEAESFEEGVHMLMRGRVDSLIRAHDVTGIRILLESADAKVLADAGIAPLLLRMPQELIRSKTYRLLASNIVHHVLERGIRLGSREEIQEYTKLKDYLAELNEAQTT